MNNEDDPEMINPTNEKAGWIKCTPQHMIFMYMVNKVKSWEDIKFVEVDETKSDDFDDDFINDWFYSSWN